MKKMQNNLIMKEFLFHEYTHMLFMKHLCYTLYCFAATQIEKLANWSKRKAFVKTIFECELFCFPLIEKLEKPQRETIHREIILEIR